MNLTLSLILLVRAITVAEVHDLVNAGRAAEAVPRAESVVRANPESRPFQKALALALRSVGELDSAIAIYDRLLGTDGTDDDTRLGKALTLSWQGQLAAALALYSEVRPGTEEYFDAVMGAGQVSAWMGRYRDALRWYDRAESLRPGTRSIVARRAQVLSWSGQLRQAIALYRGLNQEDPENIDYLLALGQNYEWSGQPMAARRWFTLARERAPARRDIREALDRVAGVAASQAGIEFGAEMDDDAGTRGDFVDYRFRFDRRLSDQLRSSAALAWSGNRRGRLGNNYLLAQADLEYRPQPRLRFTGQVQGDVLRFGFQAATVNWELSYSRLVWSGTAGRIRFEPTQNLGAFSGSTRLVLRPLTGFRLEGSATRLQVISDGNRKTAVLAAAEVDLLAKPRLAAGYTFSYDDFSMDSPRYYTPRDLATNSLGITFEPRWNRTGLSIGLGGGINASREQNVRANIALDQQIGKRLRLALGAGYFRVSGNSRYEYGRVNAAVTRSF